MDFFTVPKKINRNVLKALSILQSSRTDFARLNDITRQVKFQMRNCVPVANIEDVVKESLCTLAKLGILMRLGVSKYALSYPVFCRLGRALPNPNTNVPGNPGKPLRRAVQDARRKKSNGHLDPWKPATKLISEESLSGDEMDKIRKRMRTNTKRIQKKKREVAHPQPGPKQVQKEEPDVPAEVDFVIRDPRPLFGPSGSTTPDTPVPSGSISGQRKRSPPRKYSQLNAHIPVVSETSLRAGSFNARVSQDMAAGVCRHGFSITPRNLSRTSAINIKQDLNEVNEVGGSDPIAVDVRSAGYTSGLEPNVENASLIGLCGSPLSLLPEVDEYVMQSLVMDEDPLPYLRGALIPLEEQNKICQVPVSTPREPSPQEFQQIDVLHEPKRTIQGAPNADMLEVPNTIFENAENKPCQDHIPYSEDYNAHPLNRSISNGFVTSVSQDNPLSTDGQVKISQSLNIETQRLSILEKLSRSASEFDFYK
ncbi:uncharacterized protein LOC108027000 [Drosophila biarmipes]|uniref:uncharacterized protein LOC108027000 n=1 Tax=Drosophila biarmipes TaxID=125945 RepID=UPI001CDA95A8|nr:uncharacterized protein LOC108027000 [Drosophila biarmipes]